MSGESAEREAAEILKGSMLLDESFHYTLKRVVDALQRRDERIAELEAEIESLRNKKSKAYKMLHEKADISKRDFHNLLESKKKRRAQVKELEAKLEAQNKVVEAARKLRDHLFLNGVEEQDEYYLKILGCALTALDKPSVGV